MILPLLYFPPISYFLHWKSSDKIIIEQHEHFQKQSFRNRMSILSANGRCDLSIPIHHNKERDYRKLKISFDENWQKIHWRTLESSYRSSPYFEYYEDKIHQLIFQKTDNLFEYNLTILDWILKILKIQPKYKLSETFEFPIENHIDLRGEFKASKLNQNIDFNSYIQVFSDRFPFEKNLSIFDFICNVGPKFNEHQQK